MWIKERVQQLEQKHGSRCPYQLAESLKIHVFQHDLHHEINGYYKYDRRNQYIVINENLEQHIQRVVCAHELGHAILHPRVNTPFMKKNTLLSTLKIEQEANRFAAELLIPDEELFKINDFEKTAFTHGVPIEIIKLKHCCKKLFL